MPVVAHLCGSGSVWPSLGVPPRTRPVLCIPTYAQDDPMLRAGYFELLLLQLTPALGSYLRIVTMTH